ncbi:MAG: hypothetical protein IT371_10885 [Deltaproteobacteria bacterium]|nr:hypothetical protein [Deltaproteobacteria bacterium]
MLRPAWILLACGLSLASPEPAAGADPTPPFARPHRLALGLSAGFGSARLSAFNQGVDDYLLRIQQYNPQVTLQPMPRPSWTMSHELSLRYYFPRYVLVQAGLATLSTWAGTGLATGRSSGQVSYGNLVLELPVLVGGYYPFFGRLYVHGALGPSVFLLSRSFWSYDLGQVSSFRAGRGGGFHLLAGADFMLTSWLALGLETRLRYLKTAALESTASPLPPLQPIAELDLTGVSLALELRFFLR